MSSLQKEKSLMRRKSLFWSILFPVFWLLAYLVVFPEIKFQPMHLFLLAILMSISLVRATWKLRNEEVSSDNLEEPSREIHFQAIDAQRERKSQLQNARIASADQWIADHLDEIKAGIKKAADNGGENYYSSELPADPALIRLIVLHLQNHPDFKGIVIKRDLDLQYFQIHFSWWNLL